MAVDATYPPIAALPPDGDAAAALRDDAARCLRAGDADQAIELLRRAVALAPEDADARLSLGVALQGKRLHAEAVAELERAQRLRPDDALPYLHAALSCLALGRSEAALAAADAARARAPHLAQAHSAAGQALLARQEPGRAETAFAAALRLAPRSADLWVLCGIARYRQGAVEGAAAAMREALRLSPDHQVAKDNLAALARGAGGAPAAIAEPAVASAAVAESAQLLSVWRPKDKAASLGLAVDFLSKMPAFGRLQFGEWSQVLFYQAAREHCFFVIDQNRRVRGFLGWALTEQALAEQWVDGRAGLRNDQCLAGDCVIINAFAAETAAANEFIRDRMRELFGGKRMLYFKRHYPDGRTRAACLSVNKFVAGHLARAGRRG
jgi:tetratricopeptide (TPR) repeat protein